MKPTSFTTTKYINTGNGPVLQTVDIGHKNYIALIDPNTAFWSLIKKNELGNKLTDQSFLSKYHQKVSGFSKEMDVLRFGLKPSAVYFNPTDRCNLNCAYCYIPENTRKNGFHMSEKQLLKALSILKEYFKTTIPKGRKPQIVFHGSEPMMNKDAIFAGVAKFADDFHFGIQTNATLLDDEDISFIKSNKIGIGISLDGPDAETGDLTRKNWNGQGSFFKAASVIEKLSDYAGFNIICTITTQNMDKLCSTVDFFHKKGVQACMLNIIRCTQKNSRSIKPDDLTAAKYFIKALDRTYELYRKTGRKLIVANFANILIGIIAPTARRLMCDISPCGGGRCFFAVSANGDLFPCSEFIGVPEFNGGNLFEDKIEKVLESKPFKEVTGRNTDKIDPCSHCVIRNFCGSPCPAEAYTMNGGMDKIGAFCAFYEEQVRYAFRLIADGKSEAYLWDGWDKGATVTLDPEFFL